MALPGAPYLQSAASSLRVGLAEVEDWDIWEDSKAAKSSAVAGVGWVSVVKSRVDVTAVVKVL